ncbi:hypothetical protein KC327_g37 [Hortaea werneckii]|nr:hypothetical protein KC327_g37 [Hortaea werneckii]
MSTTNPTATTSPKNGVVVPLNRKAIPAFSTFLLGVAEGLPVFEAGEGRICLRARSHQESPRRSRRR